MFTTILKGTSLCVLLQITAYNILGVEYFMLHSRDGGGDRDKCQDYSNASNCNRVAGPLTADTAKDIVLDYYS